VFLGIFTNHPMDFRGLSDVCIRRFRILVDNFVIISFFLGRRPPCVAVQVENKAEFYLRKTRRRRTRPCTPELHPPDTRCLGRTLTGLFGEDLIAPVSSSSASSSSSSSWPRLPGRDNRNQEGCKSGVIWHIPAACSSVRPSSSASSLSTSSPSMG
jgi:hypothetical protein